MECSQSFLDDFWNKSQNGSSWTNQGDGSFSDGNGQTVKDEKPPQDTSTWLSKLRGFQTKASNWATNGQSKWADQQSAVVTEMGQTFTTVTQGYRDYTKPELILKKSILKAMGKGYEIAGEKIVPIKNTEVLNMLNSASKGDWVKVYAAGLKNREKMEVYYYRNNNTDRFLMLKQNTIICIRKSLKNCNVR